MHSKCVASLMLIVNWLIVCGCSERHAEKPESERASRPNPMLRRSGNKDLVPRIVEPQGPTSNNPEIPVDSLMESAAHAMDRGDIDTAWEIVQKVLLREPDNPIIQFFASQVLKEKGEFDAALEMLSSINSDDLQVKLAVAGNSGEILFNIGRLTQAEVQLRKVLESDGDLVPALRMMERLCNAQGRRFESQQYTQRLIELGNFQLSELAMFCSIENQFREPELRQAMSAHQSEQGHCLVYDARDRLISHEYEAALPLLEKAVNVAPSNREAWVWLGYVLVMTERWDYLAKWSHDVPESCQSHPQYWNNLGLSFLKQSEYAQAVGAFKQTLELDPRSMIATHGSSEALIGLEQYDLAKDFRERSYRLGRTNEQVRDILASKLNRKECLELGEEYSLLGLVAVGKAWLAIGESLPVPDTGVEAQMKDVAPAVDMTIAVSKRSLPVENLLSLTAALALPEFMLDFPLSKEVASSLELQSNLASLINLENVAHTVGLEGAEYNWGRKPDETGVMIYRSLGGGVAVLDFDLNGWPDFYFSRAGGDPRNDATNSTKQLFRSYEGRFVEVQDAALLIDKGYGQGLASGDFDQDGFLDLLVCNIGSCRLYRNNGDGTFCFEYEMDLPADDSWVTAACLADIDRDTHPDLVVSRYIKGEDGFTRRCTKPGTQSYICAPQSFVASDDLLLRNLAGDGWQPFHELIRGEFESGRGLGILIGDLDHAGGNDIYVANDVSANHLFINELHEDGQVSLLQLSASSGVAVDFKGRPQGSMGLAVGDVDRNGLDDLFVTNALGEYNTLYLQQQPRLYIDRTASWGLDTDSIPLVGFGCQLLDMDNNGYLDVIVVNGELEDYSVLGQKYKMLPLVYYNTGKSMRVLENRVLGEYGSQPTLGRGLASCDYNRDGRMDVVVTHSDQSAALLENRTATNYHFIQFRLVGTNSSRDAIGASVEVRAGDQVWSESLTAGEGYFSSGQFLIHVGLGNATAIDSVTVRWPNGQQQTHDNLEIDSTYLVVESHDPVLN